MKNSATFALLLNEIHKDIHIKRPILPMASEYNRALVKLLSMREREKEPLATTCDFGVIYSLFSRPQSRTAASPRLILKISWEDKNGAVQSSAFELDLERETLTALGRKGNSLPSERFDAKWFCEWARRSIKASAER